MSLFKDLISSIQPSDSSPASVSRPASRPLVPPKAAVASPTAVPSPQSRMLKRKASDSLEVSQAKANRTASDARPVQPMRKPTQNAPSSNGQKAGTTTPAISMPYRGTAGLAAAKPSPTLVKKSAPSLNTPASNSKPNPPHLEGVGKPAPVSSKPSAPVSTPAGGAPKKSGGYMALLQKAKEKDQTKPIAPPIKHEVPKIMTKKEIERARLEAKAAAKGKKLSPLSSVRSGVKPVEIKSGAGQDKKKATEAVYQGTARPAKKAPESTYKGTARPSTSAAPSARTNNITSTKKPNAKQGRYGGYASWSDEELDEEGEEDYESDVSSDMEGGMWDVEQEERLALKAAKEEDAKALAEENSLKREKEERKRKLAALNKAAAGKRKY